MTRYVYKQPPTISRLLSFFLVQIESYHIAIGVVSINHDRLSDLLKLFDNYILRKEVNNVISFLFLLTKDFVQLISCNIPLSCYLVYLYNVKLLIN